jgi:hypothetical protein
MSHGILSHDKPESVPRIWGVPRYRLGAAVRAVPRWLAAVGRRQPDLRFDAELEIWHLAGYMAGRVRAGGASIAESASHSDQPA